MTATFKKYQLQVATSNSHSTLLLFCVAARKPSKFARDALMIYCDLWTQVRHAVRGMKYYISQAHADNVETVRDCASAVQHS